MTVTACDELWILFASHAGLVLGAALALALLPRFRLRRIASCSLGVAFCALLGLLAYSGIEAQRLQPMEEKRFVYWGLRRRVLMVQPSHSQWSPRLPRRFPDGAAASG